MMLLIPATDGVEKKFPLVTATLIIVNILVFLCFQLGDGEGYVDALAFSKTSGLLKIEAQIYDDFLKDNHRELPTALADKKNADGLFWHMMADEKFQYELAQQNLLSPNDPRFAQWQDLRQIFEADLGRVFSRNYGYSPARNNFTALFTSLFLHSSFMHLIVNMLLLWFVGSLLEVAVGRGCFIGSYLLSGIVGNLLFGLVFVMAQGPLVGSTGALAGLLGMAVVLFGRTKLQVCHSLGFTFESPAFPGWFLVPFGLVNEMIQVATGAGGDGAYVAHLGSVVVGVGFGLACLAHDSSKGGSVTPVKKGESKVDALVEQVEWNLALKKYSTARQQVLSLLKMEPNHILGLTHLFNIDKIQPETAEFQATATLFLSHLVKMPGNYEIEEYFEEYSALCPKAKVSPDILLGVGASYIRSGKTQQASHILAFLLKQDPDNAGLPACIFNLAQMHRAGNQQKEAKQCLRILCCHYPETSSGKKAMEILSPKLDYAFGTE